MDVKIQSIVGKNHSSNIGISQVTLHSFQRLARFLAHQIAHFVYSLERKGETR